MNSFIGLVKVIFAVLVFLGGIESILVPLINNSFEIKQLVISLFAAGYAYCLFYSGNTQRKGIMADKSILIWIALLYGFFCVIYFVIDGVLITSTIIACLFVLAISAEDLIRMLKKNKKEVA